MNPFKTANNSINNPWIISLYYIQAIGIWISCTFKKWSNKLVSLNQQFGKLQSQENITNGQGCKLRQAGARDGLFGLPLFPLFCFKHGNTFIGVQNVWVIYTIKIGPKIIAIGLSELHKR